MSFQRKVERNKMKKQYKEHCEGVSKKHRLSFSDFWNWNQKRKRRNK